MTDRESKPKTDTKRVLARLFVRITVAVFVILFVCFCLGNWLMSYKDLDAPTSSFDRYMNMYRAGVRIKELSESLFVITLIPLLIIGLCDFIQKRVHK